MLGRDIQYQASLTAPGGGAGSITVALQDAGSGRTVAGPKTCEYPAFRWSEWRWGCRPVGASPARGRRYMVSMWFRYMREGRMVSRTTRGDTFTW
jgi:serine/threonine-protein kinase